MKKIIIAIVAVSALMISCKGEKKEKLDAQDKVEVKEVVAENNVDLAASVVTWKGSKPTGTHNGTVALKESTLTVTDGKLTTGEFIIDMSSIKCLDLKDPKDAASLVGHLSSGDFFDVAKFPTAKFVIASVEEADGKLSITGNLTVKDTTKGITIPATFTEEGGVYTFKSEPFNIDRTEFGIEYKSTKFFNNLKDKFINDLVEMSFEVKTKAPAL
jgi:polyisoprenoid-binding protein YceI